MGGLDSLGEAYATRGRKEEAIGSYKSLELDPENGNAKAALEKLSPPVKKGRHLERLARRLPALDPDVESGLKILDGRDDRALPDTVFLFEGRFRLR